jgi:hypothetical protein
MHQFYFLLLILQTSTKKSVRTLIYLKFYHSIGICSSLDSAQAVGKVDRVLAEMYARPVSE